MRGPSEMLPQVCLLSDLSSMVAPVQNCRGSAELLPESHVLSDSTPFQGTFISITSFVLHSNHGKQAAQA